MTHPKRMKGLKVTKHIRARSPLRISLSGGGTDIEEYYSVHGGLVINSTINKYAYADIKPCKDNINIARDIESGETLRIKEEDSKIDFGKKKLQIHQAVNKRISKDYFNGDNIYCEVSTYCDAPIGSGLGSSSALTVAMVKAYNESLGLGLDRNTISTLAYSIERKDCGFAGGKQDQYAATYGGFNLIEFTKDKTIVCPLDIKNWFRCELESSIILHFSGISRTSGDIISDQKILACGKGERIEYMHRLKEEVKNMRNALLSCDIDGIQKSLNKSWHLKAKTSETISTEETERIIKRGLDIGAKSAKISGAGGGGYIMFICEPSKAIKVKRELQSSKRETIFCSFTTKGVEAWEVEK